MTRLGPTAMHSLVNAGNGTTPPCTLTIAGSWKSAQTNQQAAPKKASTTPCASLFDLFILLSSSFDHCRGKMSRSAHALSTLPAIAGRNRNLGAESHQRLVTVRAAMVIPPLLPKAIPGH